MEYPQRHPNHTLEEQSITFFRKHMPADWAINSVDRDYGQDLNLEIAEDGRYKGLELIVQLKSSAESNALGGSERQVFSISTYNYLWSNLRVVLVVKYVRSEDEAYWILMRDVPEPSQENRTFTIRLPRENRLSRLDWNVIVEHVRNVSQGKLNAWKKLASEAPEQ